MQEISNLPFIFWKMKRTCFILLLVFFAVLGQAKHLVGGDIEYTCLGEDINGNNLYEITLSVYRDCQATVDFPTNTPFDTEVILYIYNSQTNLLETSLLIPLTDTLVLPLTGSDTCVVPPANLCYARGTYTSRVTLLDNAAGYEIVWGRCCRNETIQNILQPGEFGMAVSTRIPNTALCNNSPKFRNLLPTYICLNDLFTFDHSATDADGDELRYQIVTPFSAGSQTDPIPVVPPPPFLPIAWLQGYGLNNVMDGNPALTVDPVTGVISVGPQNLGQYVFSLEVSERRNGQLISTIRRDIQVNVIDCPINFPPRITGVENDLLRGDTLLFEKDQESCFSFLISDQNGPGIGTDSLSFTYFGPHLSLTNPADIQVRTIGIDSMEVQICWNPVCDFVDFDQNFLVLQVEDQNTCPEPNRSLDTLYFQTFPPDIPTPTINCIQVLDANSLLLDWQALASDEQNGFAYFVLERDDGSGFQEVAQITDPTASGFTDTNVADAENINYCYRLTVATQCPDLTRGTTSDVICSDAGAGSGICAISYQGNALSVSWRETQANGFQSYRLYRINNQIRELVQEFTDISQTNWIDETATDPAQVYCYELGIVNGCDTELFTGEHCSIPLEVEENEFEITLQWEKYEGWIEGVLEYEVWRKTQNDDLLIASIPAISPLGWIDRNVSPDQGGSYCYRIRAIPINQTNCQTEAWSAERCITYEPSIYFATAFTPNGDGINDIFEIKGTFFQQFSIRIFNRWGKEVFMSQSIDQSWDGFAKGQPVPEGVYAFIVGFEDFAGNVLQKSGTVTVIR